MVEGARLESVYAGTYRGFESLPHRHFSIRDRSKDPKNSVNAINEPYILWLFIQYLLTDYPEARL